MRTLEYGSDFMRVQRIRQIKLSTEFFDKVVNARCVFGSDDYSPEGKSVHAVAPQLSVRMIWQTATAIVNVQVKCRSCTHFCGLRPEFPILIGCIPQALLQFAVCFVFLPWGDPLH